MLVFFLPILFLPILKSKRLYRTRMWTTQIGSHPMVLWYNVLLYRKTLLTYSCHLDRISPVFSLIAFLSKSGVHSSIPNACAGIFIACSRVFSKTPATYFFSWVTKAEHLSESIVVGTSVCLVKTLITTLATFLASDWYADKNQDFASSAVTMFS